jgi:hypothetical protein
MDDMVIGIPSRSRPDVLARHMGANMIPTSWINKSYVLVPDSQYKEYVHLNPRLAKCIVSADDKLIYGTGRARQWLLDHLPGKSVLLIDDDVNLLKRRRINERKTSTIAATEQDAERCFDLLEMWLKEKKVGQVGVGSCWFNDERPDVVENVLCGTITAVKKSALKKCDIKFSDFPKQFSDSYTTLSLILGGYTVRVTYKYLCFCPMGTNSGGGCSDYRSVESVKKAAEKFARKYPEFVSVYKRKPSMMRDASMLYNVRIQWQRAVRSVER